MFSQLFDLGIFSALNFLHILAFFRNHSCPLGFSMNFTLNQSWILAPSVFLWKTLQRFPQNYKYLLNSNYLIEFFQFFNRVFLNFNSFLRVSNPVLYRHSNLRTFSLLISYKFSSFSILITHILVNFWIFRFLKWI